MIPLRRRADRRKYQHAPQYRMIDGNHRLAAIRLLEKDHDPGAPAAIDVDVHFGLSPDIEKHIALSKPDFIVKDFLNVFFYVFVPLVDLFITPRIQLLLVAAR